MLHIFDELPKEEKKEEKNEGKKEEKNEGKNKETKGKKKRKKKKKGAKTEEIHMSTLGPASKLVEHSGANPQLQKSSNSGERVVEDQLQKNNSLFGVSVISPEPQDRALLAKIRQKNDLYLFPKNLDGIIIQSQEP